MKIFSKVLRKGIIIRYLRHVEIIFKFFGNIYKIRNEMR